MPVVAPQVTAKVANVENETIDRAAVERQIKILEALKAPASLIKMAQGFLNQ
jgi:hypothetical protein